MNAQGLMAANSSAGGPVGAPPTQAQNLLAQQQQTVIAGDNHTLLNTYIYDHLLKGRQYDIARQFLAANKCLTQTSKKPNGVLEDVSDGPKRPDDLPEPDVYQSMNPESSFLYGWWCMFWDVFAAAHKHPTARPGTVDYVVCNSSAHCLADFVAIAANALCRLEPTAHAGTAQHARQWRFPEQDGQPKSVSTLNQLCDDADQQNPQHGPDAAGEDDGPADAARCVWHGHDAATADAHGKRAVAVQKTSAGQRRQL
jgi:hypothetical protein